MEPEGIGLYFSLSFDISSFEGNPVYLLTEDPSKCLSVSSTFFPKVASLMSF